MQNTNRNRAAFVWALLLPLAGPAFAQKPAAIDPKAQEMLRQSAATYAALRSYSCDVSAELKADSLPGSRMTTLKIQFQKPDHAAVAVIRYGNTEQVYTDGKQVYSYVPDKKQYTANTLPPNVSAAAVALTQGESFIGLTLLKPDGLLANNGNIESLTLGAPEMLNGARVQTVTKTMRGGNSGHLTFFVSIGTKDHLIYRFASTLQSPTPLPVGDGKTKRVDNIENYSDIKVNQTLPDSAFLPPPDAKKVLMDPQDQRQ